MGESPVEVGTFSVDVTPPHGTPLALGTVTGVDDPLSARGVVVLADGPPVVLAAVDWNANYNAGYDYWRRRLADGAGTSPEHVAVHALHQHTAPHFDWAAHGMLLAHGDRGYRIDAAYARDAVDRVADAVGEATADAEPVSHVGAGTATVERVASNRQLLGPDGTATHVRFSSESDPAWRAAPEGLVDREVTVVGFWRDAERVAGLSYYATHPQAHGEDRVSWQVPGVARELVEAETGALQVHFTGAGGNVGVGKYNDGSPANREALARRLADGVRRAWADADPVPVAAGDVDWRCRRVALPPAERLSTAELAADLREDPGVGRARALAWLFRCERGHRVPLSRLRLGDTHLLHLPGELFVEYQLAAKRMRPDVPVAVAAYGDHGPNYVGTRAAYEMGGYEVRNSLVAPGVEEPLTAAMADLLGAESVGATPSDVSGEKPRVDPSGG